jgi:hypothetical protein
VDTGYAPNPTVVHPSLGGWTSAGLGDDSAELPAFVSIGGPSFGAGFLGVQNGPFVLQKAGAAPADVTMAPGVDRARFERRHAALDAMESRFAHETGDPKVDGRRQVYAKAVRLMQTPRLEAFDASGETEEAKDARAGLVRIPISHLATLASWRFSRLRWLYLWPPWPPPLPPWKPPPPWDAPPDAEGRDAGAPCMTGALWIAGALRSAGSAAPAGALR